MRMKLYHYLIKAAQEYVEDACPRKMSDENLFATLLYVKKLQKYLTDSIDLHVADYLISVIEAEGERRGGLLFFNVSADGVAIFPNRELENLFRQVGRKERKLAVTNALNAAEKRGLKFEKGARGLARRILLR